MYFKKDLEIQLNRVKSLNPYSYVDIRRKLKKWKWLLFFGGYTLIGLFFVAQKTISYLLNSDPIPWMRIFGSEMIYWYIWFGLTPLILWFARRITINKQQWKKGVLFLFLLSLLFAPLQNGLWLFLHLIVIEGITVPKIVSNYYQVADNYWVGVLTSFYKYWLLIGAYYGFKYYFQYREQERRSNELELQSAQLNTKLMQSRLDLLKMQLHPHFLFNAMNTISVYMNENVEKARTMLIRLSDLLRVTLESRHVQEVPLYKEIEVLNYYLDVEKARFEDDLKIEWDITPTTRDGMVPYLILQPIVENAIHHGISTSRDGGQVTISSETENGRMVLQVRDNGTAKQKESTLHNRNGIGLRNIKERLQQLYGEEHFFKLESMDEKGTVVTISIPFRTSDRFEPSDEIREVE